MTVRELISVLENYHPNTKVCFVDDNPYSKYAYSTSEVIEDHGVRAFYGDDYPALFLCGSQVGSMWELSELGLDEYDGLDEEDEDDDEDC